MSCWNTCSVYRSDWNCMMYDSWKTFALTHDHVCTVLIRWPENVRRVNNILWSFLKHCYILLNFVLFLAVHDSLWLLVTLMSLQSMKINHLNFLFGLVYCSISLVNIIPAEFLIHLLLIMAIFMECMYCVNTPSHSQMLHLFQFAGEMSNSHMHKLFQNNLYS